MLEYLIRNAGRVVAKIELIDHVWDSAADVTLNTVEVYVGYLRRKIGTDRLSTVRGVGYRLVVTTVNRFWRLSLRARLMIIGLTGVAVALIAGGLAFYGALTLSLNRTLDNEALASAQDVAALVNEDRLPRPGPGLRRPGDPGRRRPAAGGRRLGDRGPADPAAAARRAAAGAGAGRRWWCRRRTPGPWTSRCGCGRSRPGPAAEPVARDRGGALRRRPGHPDGAAERAADHLPAAARRCWRRSPTG